jgi:hypothetical protein
VWLGRKWRAFRAWFGRQTYPVRALTGCGCLFALLALPGCGFAGFLVARASYIHWFVYTAEDRAFFQNRGQYREGVPSVARRLKAEMEAIPDPEAARSRHPDWFAVRFPNGEWVFGHGVNSHGFTPGHGTLVVKDNTGRVRCFFGHVCGTNAGIEWASENQPKATLTAFFDRFAEEQPQLREWVPPP